MCFRIFFLMLLPVLKIDFFKGRNFFSFSLALGPRSARQLVPDLWWGHEDHRVACIYISCVFVLDSFIFPEVTWLFRFVVLKCLERKRILLVWTTSLSLNGRISAKIWRSLVKEGLALQKLHTRQHLLYYTHIWFYNYKSFRNKKFNINFNAVAEDCG